LVLIDELKEVFDYALDVSFKVRIFFPGIL